MEAEKQEGLIAGAINVENVDDGKAHENGNPNEDPQPAQPLYFTKDGKVVSVTGPSAFCIPHPYPPLPSNLAKNRVLRAKSEQSKESMQEGIIEAEKEFEKEAMPLPSLSTVPGSPLKKMLIPEIELAIYWDRHPYEFRLASEKLARAEDNHTKCHNGEHSGNGASTSSTIRRSKSEMNLVSKVGEIIEEKSPSRRSSSSVAAKSSRVSNISVASSPRNLSSAGKDKRTTNPKEKHSREQSLTPSYESFGNNHKNHTNGYTVRLGGDGGSDKGNDNGSCGGSTTGKLARNQPLQMKGNERKKFDDIKPSRQPNGIYDKRQIEQGHHGKDSRPKLIRSAEQLQQMEALRKSAGVQVTLDEVSEAALKSTYLCPLHGQYRRGIDRRDKGGFRTDMSSTTNVHKNCSRALKGISSRTKLIKSAETQTDDELPTETSLDSRNKRSKTALLARNLNSKIKDVMASEYHGSFRDPYKIAESEKRHLRNKILNYCFTKHSIF